MVQVVAQLLEALRYNRLVAASIFLQPSNPAVDSAYNRNKYRESFLEVKVVGA